jgi:hypothetical protein
MTSVLRKRRAVALSMPAGRGLGERQFVALCSEGVQDGKALASARTRFCSARS